jgi:type IV secretory pathway ATPase VirB11/archaellum biosynthesis ATPase
MTLDAPRRIPYHWWGDAWAKSNPLTMDDLVGRGVLDRSCADKLIAHVRGGQSVAVCATESEAGKSTLAHALISHCPPGRDQIYIRGTHESFAWRETTKPSKCTLLINEISPYMPVYLWGPALKTVLAMGLAGAQLIATAHADSPEMLVSDLEKAPMGNELPDVVALGLVVVLNYDGPQLGPERPLYRVKRCTTLRDRLQTLPG